MNARARIAALEARMPREIILTLDDGTTFHHPGPMRRFVAEGGAELRVGHGRLFEALSHTVSAEGCGLLWQVLAALVDPLRGEQPLERSPTGAERVAKAMATRAA